MNASQQQFIESKAKQLAAHCDNDEDTLDAVTEDGVPPLGMDKAIYKAIVKAAVRIIRKGLVQS